MTVLVLGASGRTGRRLVGALQGRGARVRALVRPAAELPFPAAAADLDVVRGDPARADAATFAGWLAGCDAVGCCLGHRTTLAGIFGPPFQLVEGALRRVHEAARTRGDAPPLRLVLLGTVGVRLGDEREPRAQALAMRAFRWLPPQRDNERAAAFLVEDVGAEDPRLTWAIVRPDTLFDADTPAPYDVHAAPTRPALLDPGRTSRAQAADLMARLLLDDATWRDWRGRAPVVYDRDAPPPRRPWPLPAER